LPFTPVSNDLSRAPNPNLSSRAETRVASSSIAKRWRASQSRDLQLPLPFLSLPLQLPFAVRQKFEILKFQIAFLPQNAKPKSNPQLPAPAPWA
jgi:hypothetical protein